MSLYDYGLGTLAQYELTADRSARTRGALLCYTAQGLLILREFHGSEKKLEKQQELLMKLQENGINTDYFLRNNQESLVSKDKTEQRFTFQHWNPSRPEALLHTVPFQETAPHLPDNFSQIHWMLLCSV